MAQSQRKQVKIPLRSFNNFVSLMGERWVEDQIAGYLASPFSSPHEFISHYLKIMNSEKFVPFASVLPRQIYYQMILKPFLVYDRIGSFFKSRDEVESVNELLKCRPRLQRSDEFRQTLFELILSSILVVSDMIHDKIPETQKRRTPDYLVRHDGVEFTAECVVAHESDEFRKDISAHAGSIVDRIAEYLDDNEVNGQILIDTELLTASDFERIYEESISIIEKAEDGSFNLLNNTAKIVYQQSGKKDEVYPNIDDFLKQKHLFSSEPYNLSSSLDGGSNGKREVRNIREVVIKHRFDIHRSILSTISNKNKSEQWFNDKPHILCVFLPFELVNHYERLDYSEIEKKVAEYLVPETNYVVLVEEKFGKQRDTWRLWYEYHRIANVKPKHFLDEKVLDWGEFPERVAGD